MTATTPVGAEGTSSVATSSPPEPVRVRGVVSCGEVGKGVSVLSHPIAVPTVGMKKLGSGQGSEKLNVAKGE